MCVCVCLCLTDKKGTLEQKRRSSSRISGIQTISSVLESKDANAVKNGAHKCKLTIYPLHAYMCMEINTLAHSFTNRSVEKFS